MRGSCLRFNMRNFCTWMCLLILRQTASSCPSENVVADIVFAIDESSSLSPDDFHKAKTAAADLLSKFIISPERVQAGVISYSKNVNKNGTFFLKDNNNRTELSAVLMQIPFILGSTNTAGALNYAQNYVFKAGNGDRGFAQNILIVMTDGDSDDQISTRHAATELKGKGIICIGVGIGQYNEEELEDIASDKSFVVTFNNYDELQNLSTALEPILCQISMKSDQSTGSSALEAWKIAIIAVSTGTVLVTLAVVAVRIFCCKKAAVGATRKEKDDEERGKGPSKR